VVTGKAAAHAKAEGLHMANVVKAVAEATVAMSDGVGAIEAGSKARPTWISRN